MQANHSFDYDGAIQVGHAVRVLCVMTGANAPGRITATASLPERLATLGGRIEIETELYTALAAIIEDPSGCDLLVLDCDGAGADSMVQTAMRILCGVGSRVPVLVISKDFATHSFPDSRGEAVRLRAPVSDLSLRIGYEHALRDLSLWLAA